MADIVIDAKGLQCPLPIVRIAKAVKNMDSGQTIEVVSTDLAFPEDVKAWCKVTGNILDNLTSSKKAVTAIIKIK